MTQRRAGTTLAGGLAGVVVLTATIVWAATTLTDPSGHLWDIDVQGTGTPTSECGSGRISNGSIDAYDSFMYMCVTAAGTAWSTQCSTADAYCGVVAPVSEMSGRQLALGVDTMMGLEVQRRVYVPSSGPATANSFARYLDTFHNPTGAAITFQLRLGSAIDAYADLGSDGSTTCEGSSSGDAVPDVGDEWFTTDDTDGSGDPSLGFVVQGVGAGERIDFVALDPFGAGSSEVDELMWAFDDLTVAPGETIAILSFLIQDDNQTSAQAEAAFLALAQSEAVDGLTGVQLSAIRNFSFCYDCDGDGYDIDAGDCNDWDDTVHPGVTTDYCDGQDNDCNPATDDGASETWYMTVCDGDDVDSCEDGFHECVGGVQTCVDGPESGIELCDGIDNDCDPATADGSGDDRVGAACDGDDADLCAEGLGSCESGVFLCSDTDDDTPELCDGVDNDCDPATPDGAEEDYYGVACDGPDADLCEEGVGGCISGVQTCDDTTGDIDDLCNLLDDDCNPATLDGADEEWAGDPCDGPDADLCGEGTLSCVGGVQTCDDFSSDNVEICNGVDDDCNPATSELADNDGDGVSACGGDCNDADPTIYPGATEVCADGIDQDCDVTTDHDTDGDGFYECADDCAPLNANIYPGAAINCTNGLDNDCNGVVDALEFACQPPGGVPGEGCGCTMTGADSAPPPWLVLVAIASMALLVLRRRLF